MKPVFHPDSTSGTASAPFPSGVWTQKNGAPASEVVVTRGKRPKRPAPGHFGTIEPRDRDEVLRPLYPALPEQDAG